MLDKELEYLAKLAQRSKYIAEVGSWKGRSTAAFSDNTSGKVFAIDTWLGSDEPQHKLLLSGKSEDWLFSEFYKQAALNVVPIRMQSVNAAAMFAELGLRFDVVFIDASHKYQDLAADIIAWKPLVTAHGVLCGHDYTTEDVGVVRAVTELVPKFTVVPDTSIWTTDEAIHQI